MTIKRKSIQCCKAGTRDKVIHFTTVIKHGQIKFFTLDKTCLSLMMYSYVVMRTLNFVLLMVRASCLRNCGLPLYAIFTTVGAHLSNSYTQFDKVLQKNFKLINHNFLFNLISYFLLL